MILLSYLLVGYGTPLGVRSTSVSDHQVVRKEKSKSLPKSIKASLLWKVFKHIPASSKQTGPDLTCLILSNSYQNDRDVETLDNPHIRVLAYNRSALHRQLRAPPVS